jgi:hypothetical protein
VGLQDVSPRLPMKHDVDSALADTESSGNVSLLFPGRPAPADLAHVIFRQYGFGIFSALKEGVQHMFRVVTIGLCRYVLQIRQSIIGFVSVDVIYLSPRPLSYKRGHHEAMHKEALHLSVDSQCDRHVSISIARLCLDKADPRSVFRRCSAYVAKIRDFIVWRFCGQFPDFPACTLT